MTRTPVLLIALTAVSLLVACGQEAEAPAAADMPAQPAAPAAPPPAPAAAPAGVPAYITAAVEDPGRPDDQRQNDAARMPGAVIAFAGVMPGDVVVDYRPGGGYYTRMLSKVVGPEGRVIATESAERAEGRPDRTEAVVAIAADPAYGNVEVATPPFAALDEIGEQVDVVWLTNNYHDIVNAETVEGMVPFNEGVFRALKPGGTYFIVDHAAPTGSGYADTNTTHRIDGEVVKQAIEAVGFVLDGESDMMGRPEDDRAGMSSFATAQLVLRFRKPE
jgi:predicted methyltransferase